MQFKRIPADDAPLGGALIYEVAADASTDLVVRILDDTSNRCYGAKRFADVAGARFDIAPYLRRALRFTPTLGRTGIHAGTGRVLPAVVEVTAADSRQVLTAPLRTFLPTAEAVSAPALLTAMPVARLIPEGACDELTLVTDGPLEISFGIAYGLQTVTESHQIPSAGLHIFRINTADFPFADTLTVNAGPCGRVVYSVMKPVEGAVRLAWRSRCGSIEHYSFPVEAKVEVEASKQHAYGAEGHTGRTSFEELRKVRSALETRPMLEALSELIYSPEVWLVETSSYTPVDIVTDRAVVHNYGTLSCLEITFRPKTRPATPWN